MKYNLIATGSEDCNALILEDKVLIDIGTPFAKIKPWAKQIEVVLLTHHHGDHLNKAAVNSLIKANPTVIFLTPTHLVEVMRNLRTKAGEKIVYDRNILEAVPDKVYTLFGMHFSSHRVPHANGDMTYCPNVAWKIKIGNEKALYVTDTHDISTLTAKGFNNYFIEMNYREDELQQLIEEDKEAQGFSHRVRSRDTHLSIEKAEEALKSWVDESVSYKIVPLHMSKIYVLEFNTRYEKGELRK